MKRSAAICFAVALLLSPVAPYAAAQEDLTPPVLLDVQFSPEQVDTSKAPATLTVTVHVRDDLSGMRHVALFFRKAGTTQTAQVEFRPSEGWSEVVSGDLFNGRHRATMTLPRYAARGEWEMYSIALEDNVGNRADLSRPAEGEAKSGPQWPALYNGFLFAVGADDTAPAAMRIYLPAALR